MATRGIIYGEVAEAEKRLKMATEMLAQRYGRVATIADQWPNDSVHGPAVVAVWLAELAEAVVKLTAEVDALKPDAEAEAA